MQCLQHYLRSIISHFHHRDYQSIGLCFSMHNVDSLLSCFRLNMRLSSELKEVIKPVPFDSYVWLRQARRTNERIQERKGTEGKKNKREEKEAEIQKTKSKRNHTIRYLAGKQWNDLHWSRRDVYSLTSSYSAGFHRKNKKSRSHK